EFVGSDARAAESAIRAAAAQPKAAIRIAEASGSVTVEVDPLPAGAPHKATVFAAYAADSGTQDVTRGENKGRRLRHVAIVKELKPIGAVDGRSPFKVQLPLQTGSRFVVFVQESGNGPVWGSAMLAAVPRIHHARPIQALDRPPRRRRGTR